MKPGDPTALRADLSYYDPETIGDTAEFSTAVPPPVEAVQIPEASTWMLLIPAAALWLLRLRSRASRRSRGVL